MKYPPKISKKQAGVCNLRLPLLCSNHALMTLSARPRLESPEISRRVVDDGDDPYEDVPLGDEAPESNGDPFTEVVHPPTKVG